MPSESRLYFICVYNYAVAEFLDLESFSSLSKTVPFYES
jgi:hypothetical protein